MAVRHAVGMWGDIFNVPVPSRLTCRRSTRCARAPRTCGCVLRSEAESFVNNDFMPTGFIGMAMNLASLVFRSAGRPHRWRASPQQGSTRPPLRDGRRGVARMRALYAVGWRSGRAATIKPWTRHRVARRHRRLSCPSRSDAAKPLDPWRHSPQG